MREDQLTNSLEVQNEASDLYDKYRNQGASVYLNIDSGKLEVFIRPPDDENEETWKYIPDRGNFLKDEA